MKFLALIPARYASTRFPAKPLALLGGRPIIQHVYERVKEVFDDVYVATDNELIASCVRNFGGKAVMTREDHKSGTDRCHEAYLNVGGDYDVIVNVQGDEPFISASQLHTIKNLFDDATVDIATLVKPFAPTDGWAALSNPNSPKVVVNQAGEALYFSRSVIPYLRGVETDEWLEQHEFLRHIGLYAYRAEALERITKLPQSPLEKAESLEQLRWLEAGMKIKVGRTDIETIGIDTPEDLKRAEDFLNNK